ncbi:LysR substrate-binding domain-containing protein [Intestinibacter sp.]|uniref:LysR substrate-binding domain-containing protein n=1 Tax=Intestinibacter sp. TaxID=1965304 RepID=UPI003F14FFC2
MLQELKTFISVVELNNLIKCSNHLKLPQKLIIEHIEVLELFFGVTLLDRPITYDNNVSITENGMNLYIKSKKMFNIVEEGNYDDLKQINTLKSNIKIGVCDQFEKYILPKFSSYFSKKYPNIKIDVFTKDNDCIYNDLKQNKLNIGIIEETIQNPEFIQKRFLSDKMILMIPYAETIKDISTYVNEFKDKTWFISREDLSTKYFTDKFLNNSHITVKEKLLDDNNAVKEAVKNNLGISVIPKSAIISAYKGKEISILPLEESFAKHYSYVIPSKVKLSECVNIFLNELRNYYKNIYYY